MIIDCHGHFTTVPASFRDWRAKQVAAANDPASAPPRDGAHVGDDQIREAIGNGQLKLQQERGYDLTLFSPIAGLMSHHLGNERTSIEWAEISNDLVYRVTELFPENFAPVCQLPQSPGAAPRNVIPELRRCVEQLGFVGCNLNPDPTGGYWTGKPMTDREWYPVYEALVDLGQRIIDFFAENALEHERTGEMIERIGLVNFLEGVGIEVTPHMVSTPRTNPYVRTDGWDEEGAKLNAKKAA